MDAAEKELQECRRELFRLLNENAALRYAAMTFGDLAERLNFLVAPDRSLGLLPASQRTLDYSPPDKQGGPPVEPGISPRHRPDVPGADADE